MRTTDNLASSIENGYFLSHVVMRKGQDNLHYKFLKPGQTKSLSLFHFILQKIVKQDISLDYYKVVTNQGVNKIFQIWLETCLARHLRASLFDLPSANFF